MISTSRSVCQRSKEAVPFGRFGTNLAQGYFGPHRSLLIYSQFRLPQRAWSGVQRFIFISDPAWLFWGSAFSFLGFIFHLFGIQLVQLYRVHLSHFGVHLSLFGVHPSPFGFHLSPLGFIFPPLGFIFPPFQHGLFSMELTVNNHNKTSLVLICKYIIICVFKGFVYVWAYKLFI